MLIILDQIHKYLISILHCIAIYIYLSFVNDLRVDSCYEDKKTDDLHDGWHWQWSRGADIYNWKEEVWFSILYVNVKHGYDYWHASISYFITVEIAHILNLL